MTDRQKDRRMDKQTDDGRAKRQMDCCTKDRAERLTEYRETDNRQTDGFTDMQIMAWRLKEACQDNVKRSRQTDG